MTANDSDSDTYLSPAVTSCHQLSSEPPRGPAQRVPPSIHTLPVLPGLVPVLSARRAE